MTNDVEWEKENLWYMAGGCGWETLIRFDFLQDFRRSLFRAGMRAVMQWNVLDHQIQNEKQDHEKGADHENPLDSSEQGRSDIGIHRREKMRAVFVSTEYRFQLGMQLGQQQRI